MEYALTADHHRIHAFDAEKWQEYYCPVCGNQVIPRQGEVNSWHFAHVTSCMDDWKYDMSEWHRGWQSRFPENVREIVVEHRGECHRADILMGGYAIEFQHSPISAGEFERRNKFYTRAGYKVIWVFDETYGFWNEYISSSLDDENKFVWKWPNRVLASVVPQRSTDTPTYSERSLDYFYQVALPLHAAILKSNQIHHQFLRRGFMLPPFYAGIKIGNLEVIIMTVFSRKIMRQYTFYIVFNFKTL